MTKSLDQALFYRNLNLSIIPIAYKSKKPLLKWKVYQERLPDPEEIKLWFESNQEINIGIVTGRISRLVVIDVDEKGAVPEWLRKTDTWVSSTGRGYHFYFYIEEDEIVPTTKLAEKIDLKAEGSYVLVPESVHPSGHKYRWKRFIKHLPRPAPFEAVKSHVLELISRNGQGSRVSAELYRGVEKGRRNISLTRIAGSLFSDGLNEEEVYEVLFFVNQRNIPPLAEREVRTIVRSIRKRRRDYTREGERILSALVPAIIERIKKDPIFRESLRKTLLEIEELRIKLPEKDSIFFEKEIGKTIFPELLKALRYHLISHSRDSSCNSVKDPRKNKTEGLHRVKHPNKEVSS